MTNDTDDLDFAMLTPPTILGPCKAASAPEVDPVEAELRRNIERAGYKARHLEMALVGGQAIVNVAIEVRHGSGKVKV